MNSKTINFRKSDHVYNAIVSLTLATVTSIALDAVGALNGLSNLQHFLFIVATSLTFFFIASFINSLGKQHKNAGISVMFALFALAGLGFIVPTLVVPGFMSNLNMIIASLGIMTVFSIIILSAHPHKVTEKKKTPPKAWGDLKAGKESEYRLSELLEINLLHEEEQHNAKKSKVAKNAKIFGKNFAKIALLLLTITMSSVIGLGVGGAIVIPLGLFHADFVSTLIMVWGAATMVWLFAYGKDMSQGLYNIFFNKTQAELGKIYKDGVFKALLKKVTEKDKDNKLSPFDQHVASVMAFIQYKQDSWAQNTTWTEKFGHWLHKTFGQANAKMLKKIQETNALYLKSKSEDEQKAIEKIQKEALESFKEQKNNDKSFNAAVGAVTTGMVIGTFIGFINAFMANPQGNVQAVYSALKYTFGDQVSVIALPIIIATLIAACFAALFLTMRNIQGALGKVLKWLNKWLKSLGQKNDKQPKEKKILSKEEKRKLALKNFVKFQQFFMFFSAVLSGLAFMIFNYMAGFNFPGIMAEYLHLAQPGLGIKMIFAIAGLVLTLIATSSLMGNGAWESAGKGPFWDFFIKKDPKFSTTKKVMVMTLALVNSIGLTILLNHLMGHDIHGPFVQLFGAHAASIISAVLFPFLFICYVVFFKGVIEDAANFITNGRGHPQNINMAGMLPPAKSSESFFPKVKEVAHHYTSKGKQTSEPKGEALEDKAEPKLDPSILEVYSTVPAA